MLCKYYKVNITKRKFKRGWSTIQLISTKRTIVFHPKSFNIETNTTYDVGNPSHDLGQAQTCGGFLPVNGIPTSLLIIGSPMAIQNIYKRLKNLHRFASIY